MERGKARLLWELFEKIVLSMALLGPRTLDSGNLLVPQRLAPASGTKCLVQLCYTLKTC
jgi:electron transfer flavoprotein alpha/beta subunit